MKSYASNRPGTNLACFLAVFGMVLTGGSAIAQLVIDYPRDRGTVVVTFMEVLGEIKDQDPGPAYQVLGSDGFRFTRFVLNPDFRETKFVIVDVGGSKDVVVSGRDTSGAQKEPAYQLFNGNRNLIVTRFVLESRDFHVSFLLLMWEVTGYWHSAASETSGLSRGPAYQIFESHRTLLQAEFVFNPDF